MTDRTDEQHMADVAAATLARLAKLHHDPGLVQRVNQNRAFPITLSIGTVPGIGSPVHNSPR